MGHLTMVTILACHFLTVIHHRMPNQLRPGSEALHTVAINQPLFSVPNQREQLAHQYQQGYSDGPDQPSGLNATIAWLLADVQHLSESMDQQHVTNNQLLTSNQQLENSNQQLVESNQQLTMRVKAIELLQTESKNMGKKKAGLKNVSNEHSLLKVSYRTVE